MIDPDEPDPQLDAWLASLTRAELDEYEYRLDARHEDAEYQHWLDRLDHDGLTTGKPWEEACE